mmetsp:Transcript_12332/g.25092  ORF Transcript_12332/g.25092 Transcript_12332/m.25092 type:complete len:190 (-) Transcript_12332:199-768(-)
MTPKDYVAAGCSGCMVDRGFYFTYRAVQKHVRESVSSYKKTHPKAALWITGHSLGGALAVHAAVDLRLAGNEITGVYTFGQPRVGNRAFAQWFSAGLGTSRPHYRVTHRFDPVPHLPMHRGPIGGFFHVPTEVYYPKQHSDEGAVICDGSGEDPNCSDSNFAEIVVTDHLFYVGFHFVKNYIGCKKAAQ